MPSPAQPKVFNLNELIRYDELPLTNVPLFQHEHFSACLLGFLPGQVLPRHYHDHEHEIFDVLEGTGTIWLNGDPIEASPGVSVFVPAGVEHGFENTGSEKWVIRATITERVYARQALRQAIGKRLGTVAR